jgi:hypothetical protein
MDLYLLIRKRSEFGYIYLSLEARLGNELLGLNGALAGMTRIWEIDGGIESYPSSVDIAVGSLWIIM